MTTRAQKAADDIVAWLFDAMGDTSGIDSIAVLSMREYQGLELTEAVRARIASMFGPCAAKADEAEPIFTLRAQDKSAVAALGMWITFAEREGAAAQKLDGAREIQRQMIEWQAAHAGSVKAAD